MLEKAKEKLEKLRSGELFQEHIGESIQSVSELAPILKKNGYELKDIELELGLPTGITICLVRNNEVLGSL
ncbi:MAG: hypothetical protein KDK36_11095, partial [Leptospiraceae bacterium]|nr:hypothetical protein [Leptospiraceae bacterium]